MAPDNSYNYCYQLRDNNGNVIASFSNKGIECTTFEPETYNRYDYCVVKDTGKSYTNYKSFVKEHCYPRLSDWVQ